MKFIFCDIVGVLHDNYTIYDGVIQTLKQCKENNIKIILISNTPRRAFKVKSLLNSFGITKDLYFDVITSGEVFYQTFLQILPKKSAFFLGFEKDLDYTEGTNVRLEYHNYKNCDFAIISGFRNKGDQIDSIKEDLQNMKNIEMKAYCINPDLHVVKQNGEIDLYCAGTIAKYYEEIGGSVEYFGKPFEKIYNFAYNLIGCPQKEEIIAIGDAMNTDIKGAKNFGIKSILVNSGLHKNNLDFSNFSFQPNYIVENFSQIINII